MSAPAPWKIRDLLDVLVEEPERRRVREHQRRRSAVDLGAQVLDVDVAARVGLDVRQLVAGHGHRGGVRPVRGVGDDDLAPPLGLPALLEVRADEHEPGQLALAAGGRLERDGGRPVTSARISCRRHISSSAPCAPPPPAADGGRAKPGSAATRSFNARVVLHRAGAERVEARVDPEVPGRSSVKWRTSSNSGTSGRRGGSCAASSAGSSGAAGSSGRGSADARRPAATSRR